MGRRAKAVESFPHIKGLQKKQTRNGHRWVLSDKDSRGKTRFVTVKISDSDSRETFERKVEEARAKLHDRFDVDLYRRLADEYIAMKRMADRYAKFVRSYIDKFSIDERRNEQNILSLMRSKRKNSSIRIILGIIHRFFNWMNRKGVKIKDPTECITVKSANTPRSRIATANEIKMLVDKVRSRNDKEYLLFLLIAIHTGARMSTIETMSSASMDDTGHLALYNTKANKPYSYRIKINDKELVELWNEVTADGVLWHKKPSLYRERLKSTMARMFTKDQNGETLSPHSLRHTFASNAIRAGVPLEIISKLLDHRSMSTTLSIYAKFSQNQIDGAIEQIENIHIDTGGQKR